MGTQYHINIPLIANHHFDQKKLKHKIDVRLQAINQEMSTYIPDSTPKRYYASQPREKHRRRIPRYGIECCRSS